MEIFSLLLWIFLIKSTSAAPTDQYEQLSEINKISLQKPLWNIKFAVNTYNITMMELLDVELIISDVPVDLPANSAFQVMVEHPELLHINLVIPYRDINTSNNEWRGNVTMEALFLGRTNVYVVLLQDNKPTQHSTDVLHVVVLRNIGNMDTAFKLIMGSFVMILYINFGAAVDPNALKDIILRPVGPAIGFGTKFLIMPILGYMIGYYFFHDQVDLRLGLFFTAVTPAGGSSNIFTALLDGNLNLSVTMTAISNLCAFIMMPIWIFTLGALIFHEGNFAIPYDAIASTSCSLVLPLSVGILLQKYRPQYVSGLVRYLKSFSLALIILLMIFAFYVNSYIFKLFTIKIVIAGATLSWCGYFFGWLVATLLGQSQKDALTIAIETGIENTGIAIFMLNFTLPQPTADITSAVPIANSAMTPIPLLLMYLVRKLYICCCNRRTSDDVELEVKEVIPITTKKPLEETEMEAEEIMKQTKAELRVL